MSETRERLAAHVVAHPGLHVAALGRALDLAPGQLQYHLRRLRAADRVVREEFGGRTHYFSPEYGPDRRREIAVLRRETARDVLAVLLEEGPTAPAGVADRLAVARSTVEYHLEGLCGESLVEKHRDERNRVTLTVPDRERAATRLRVVTPTLPDRLLDRFTRLVDDALEAGE